MKIIPAVAAIASMALLVAGPAVAENQVFVRTKGVEPQQFRFIAKAGPSPFIFLLNSADLSSDQRARIRSVVQRTGEQAEARMKQLNSIEKQISDKLVMPGKLTMADLTPLVAQESQIRQAIAKSGLETALRIRAILTPNQLKHVAQVRDKLESLQGQIEQLMGPAAGGAELIGVPFLLSPIQRLGN